MGFWAADPPGWRHRIRERFGYDPMRSTAGDALESVYYLLREQVRSDVGLLREAPPRRPDPCAFGDAKALSTAEEAWRVALCGCARWTTDEELDAHLTEGLTWRW